VAQPCSCCDRPATHQFAVSYRGRVLTGAICEEHGKALARERLGIQESRLSLGPSKIGLALIDPHTTPHFQRIGESERQEIIPDTGRPGFDRSSENGFSFRRRRSMSRWRYSGSRRRRGTRAGLDIELVMIPDIAHPGGPELEPDNVRISDTSLVPIGG
jgi:hypothetical protein